MEVKDFFSVSFPSIQDVATEAIIFGNAKKAEEPHSVLTQKSVGLQSNRLRERPVVKTSRNTYQECWLQICTPTLYKR